MKKHSADNERIKRRYFAYLKEAKRYSEPTIDAVAKALDRFENDTKFRDFKTYHFEQAIAFKRRLAEERNLQTGERLSKSTLHATLAHLRNFFQWLAGQPGYRSRMRYTDADYFNLSEKDVRIATARRDKSGPTVEQTKHVISLMPCGSHIERRNRALIAFFLLTGARDGAVASLKLKHIDIPAGSVFQDAREVDTKFSKTFTTYFFPVGDEIRDIVVDWVHFLRRELLWGNDDPLFPTTRVAPNEAHQFSPCGLARQHWSTAGPIREIFRTAFAAADLPYFNPHSIRNTLVRLALSVCKTPEEFKAWSQNLGHEKVLTTFLNYGQVEGERQGELIRTLAQPRQHLDLPIDAIAEAIASRMRDQEELRNR